MLNEKMFIFLYRLLMTISAKKFVKFNDTFPIDERPDGNLVIDIEYAYIFITIFLRDFNASCTSNKV